MNYSNESDLQADGFILTPNIFNSGKGSGKVYEKIVHEVDQPAQRVFYSVDVDGTVAPWVPNSGVTPTVQEVVPPTPEAQVAPVEVVADAPEAQN